MKSNKDVLQMKSILQLEMNFFFCWKIYVHEWNRIQGIEKHEPDLKTMIAEILCVHMRIPVCTR